MVSTRTKWIKVLLALNTKAKRKNTNHKKVFIIFFKNRSSGPFKSGKNTLFEVFFGVGVFSLG